MTTWVGMDGSNGDLRPDERGLQYGDGLFETIAIRGGQPRLWYRHMARLSSSCARLSIACPDESALRELLERALDKAGTATSDATAKLIVTAGTGDRGYARPHNMRPTVIAGVFAAKPIEVSRYADGVDVVTCQTCIAEQPALAGLKTLNRLEQVLAKMEIGSAFEGLMCDAANRVICGTMSNVFIVTDGQVATPSLQRCGVEGVARAELLARSVAQDFPIDVRDIRIEECLQADELILSNSQFGVLRARSIDGRDRGEHAVYDRLSDALLDAGFRECKR